MADEHRSTQFGGGYAREPDDPDHRSTQFGGGYAREADAGDHRSTQFGTAYAYLQVGGEHRSTQLGGAYALTPGEPAHRSTQFGGAYAEKVVYPWWTQAIPLAAPTSFGEPLVPVIEVDFDTGTRRYSVVGIRTLDQGFIDPGVRTFGSYLRELPSLRGEFRVAELQVDLDNSDGRWSELRATEGWRGREARVKLGDPREPYAEWFTAYRGELAEWRVELDRASIVVVDPWSRFLGHALFFPITIQNFPLLPDTTPPGNIAPVIVGIHETQSGHRKGAIPAFLIDPQFNDPVLGTTFRYVACQGDIEGIGDVYNYGELVDPSEYNIVSEPLQGGVGGDTINYIDFADDPREGGPLSPQGVPEGADTSIAEVTFDARGLVEEIGASTIENPARQLRHLLIKHANATASPGDPSLQEFNDITLLLDEASIAKAEQIFNALNITGAVWIKNQITTRELLEKFSESFGLSVTSSADGKMRFIVPTKELSKPGFKTWLQRGVHVLDEGFAVTGPDRVISVAQVNYDYDVVRDEFASTESLGNPDHDTIAGEAGELNLWYVRGPTSKGVTAEQFFFAAAEGRQHVELRCDPHLVDDVEVGDEVALTHVAGPSSDGQGYRAKMFQATSIGLTLDDPVALTVRLRELQDLRLDGSSKVFGGVFWLPGNQERRAGALPEMFSASQRAFLRGG